MLWPSKAALATGVASVAIVATAALAGPDAGAAATAGAGVWALAAL